MAVTEVGTPAALAQATSGSVTGTWSGTQPRTAGNALVAKVTAFALTSSTAISTPAGWTKVGEGYSTSARAAIYVKTAAGGDAAPNFTSTLSGSYPRMTCQLQELTGQDATTIVDTSGFVTTGSGTTITVTTDANVSRDGGYAVSLYCLYIGTTARTITWTPGTGWANEAGDGGTSQNSHFETDYANPAPASGSPESQSPTSSRSATRFAGIIVVILGPPPATNAPAQLASGTGSSPAADPNVGAAAGCAQAAGTAPAVTGTTVTNAPAGLAAGTGTAGAVTVPVTLSNSAEGIPDATRLTAGTGGNTGGDSGQYYDEVSGAGVGGADVVGYSTSPAHGARCIRFTSPGSAAVYVGWTSALMTGLPTRAYFRIAFRSNNIPAVNYRLANFRKTEGGILAGGLNVLASTGQVRLVAGAGATTVVTSTGGICDGSWWRIEGYHEADATGTAGKGRLQVFAGDSTTATYDSGDLTGVANGTSYVNSLRAGICNSVATGSITVDLDDVGFSSAGPLGPVTGGQAVNANAGLAAGTGTAPAPAPGVSAAAGLAAGTGSAPVPQAVTGITANAGLAASTGTAGPAGSRISAAAGLARGTAAPPLSRVAHWVTPAWNIHLMYGQDAAGTAAQFGDAASYGQTATYDGTAPTWQQYDGLGYTPVLMFKAKSTSVGLDACIANGHIGSFQWVYYDIENWAETPDAEKQDPFTSIPAFCAAAHAAGLSVIVSAAKDLADACTTHPAGGLTNDEWYETTWPDGCSMGKALSYADIGIVQTQTDTLDVPAFSLLYNTVVAQAQAGPNPGTPIWCGLSSSWGDAGQRAVAFGSVPAAGSHLTISPNDPPNLLSMLDMFSRIGFGGTGRGAVTANAGLAAGTGTSPQASVTATGATNANAGLAVGTGTAYGPGKTVSPAAPAATGTGTAPQPTALVGTLAPTGLAAGTGTAPAPSSALRVTPATPTATGTAAPASGLAAPAAAAATGSGTGYPAKTAISGSAPAAVGAGTAPAPTAVTGSNTNAPAGLAQATGSASPAGATAAPSPPAASGTGTALPPGGSVAAKPTAATATATGYPATATRTRFAPAGVAAGTGSAAGPAAITAPVAPVALATGTAPAAVVEVILRTWPGSVAVGGKAAVPAAGGTVAGTVTPGGKSGSVTPGGEP